MLKPIKSLLKAKSVYIAILVTIVIVFLSIMKVGKQPISFNHLDKVQHCIAYTVLSFFWLLSIRVIKKRKLTIVILCVLFGVFMEVLQGTTSYRTFDYLDMIANTIGVVIGFLLSNVFIKNNNLIN